MTISYLIAKPYVVSDKNYSKNVTLKEIHLHANKQALFQLCFTKFSQKKYTYQM